MKKIKLPLFILNFKTFNEVNGENGLNLAKIAEKVMEELGVSIAVCPPIPFLAKYTECLNLPIFSQKLDNLSEGNTTGMISVETIKAAAVSGTLVNHNENKMILADLEKVIRDARTHRLFTVVCANNEAACAAVAKFDPHAVAFMPADFEDTGISATPSHSELLKDIIKRIKLENPKVAPFCGAGIYGPNDIKIALKLGIEGFLLSDVYVKAKNPYDVLYNLSKTTLT